MLDINNSNKLTNGEEYAILSEQYVFFRLTKMGTEFQFMTATASEDKSHHRAYPDLNILTDATTYVLRNMGVDIEDKKDRKGRKYIKAIVPNNKEYVEDLSINILERLGIDVEIEIKATNEMKDLYFELSHDDDEDVYLSDGVYLTKDGKLIDTK